MSQYSFAQVPKADIYRNKFDLTHDYKTAFDSGYLIPFFVCDVLPGDTFDLTSTMVARLTTPIVPVMDSIHLDTMFFYVPNRLVWDNFQRFMGEQKNPGDSIDFTEPQIQLDTAAEVGSVFDYVGIPTGISDVSQEDWPSALPFRAINLIYNEWFRDENLQDSKEVRTDDGPDPMNLYSLLRRGKRKDYFTSSLPFAQKGPGINLPLSGTVSVRGDGTALVFTDGNASYAMRRASSPACLDMTSISQRIPVGSSVTATGNLPANVALGLSESTTHSTGLVADLSTAGETITINTMRQAFAMQRLLETLARSGSRYTELLLGVFGVQSPDARLQRPEFLGGTQDFMNVMQVPQTSSTDGTTPQGHMAAYGYMSSVRKHGFTKSFVEHGWVIGFVNVWTDQSYQQGLQRCFSRRTRWDYYWPQLANIGEQAVLNKEIYLSSDTDQNNEAFGFQERYAEYRYFPSKITGRLRSTAESTLDVWHLAQKFDTLPKLNSTFIEQRPPLSRVLAVQNEPQIFLDVVFNFKAIRPLPLFGIPGMGNRF